LPTFFLGVPPVFFGVCHGCRPHNSRWGAPSPFIPFVFSLYYLFWNYSGGRSHPPPATTPPPQAGGQNSHRYTRCREVRMRADRSLPSPSVPDARSLKVDKMPSITFFFHLDGKRVLVWPEDTFERPLRTLTPAVPRDKARAPTAPALRRPRL